MRNFSRRGFLETTGALGLAAAGGSLPGRALGAAPHILEARPGTARLAPAEYRSTPIWGYEGGVPGPTLRVKQGERIGRRFLNGLPQASTIHWHGIRIANAMDGVPELTQAPVEPGATFDYEFQLPDAGTYWYHPHNKTWEQLARGLYGALVVEEAETPDVDRDEVLLIDDWRLTEKAEIAENFGAMHDWSHGGRIGNWITVNGDGYWASTAKRNERLRLRLVNVANARIFSLGLKGFDGWIVALDGQPLATPQRAGRMVMAPAQRIDLIVDVTGEAGSEASIVSHERNGSYAVAAFEISESAAARRTEPVSPLPPNPVPETGPLGKARTADLLMEGGAMGGLRGATMGGRAMDMRGLVQKGKVWAFNGRADMPEEPLIAASAGETVRIRMENRTGWPHAMHLHGHHFRKVLENGGLGALRDTMLMQAEEVAEIAFVADNPGNWLLHCHMVEHSAAGMMTWIRVT
ncbi:multicopper oxidase family protein [Nisaea acidiphila]|uniref:Multicopper oxidase family protein n=1 Tax=Nisaea acidiphila TaxID=1862145 RepID=A0A9J7ARF2_9PROT|nr:multicopper oxidase family protein [Nisaea acidiphila]UUX49815.1 multicopper oxidase family protein [Nisaea acidiphila]